METPTYYNDVCQKALDVGKRLGLTDTQILLYNHICRGDFYLRNDGGQAFYDQNHEGFGWDGDRVWVKKQFKPLIEAKLVTFKSLRDCRDDRYVSWVFYDPNFDYDFLVEAECYVNTWQLATIKNTLNLPDGFNKDGKYGDFEFVTKKRNKKYNIPAQIAFKYKGSFVCDYYQEIESVIVPSKIGKAPLFFEIDDFVDQLFLFLRLNNLCDNLHVPFGYRNTRRFEIREPGENYG